MEQEEVSRKLQTAIDILHQKDAIILDAKYNLNERTITFRLAMYLCKQFSNYDVDCEYNRMIDPMGDTTEGDYWVKRVNLVRDDTTCDDDEARTVFPDIIIHKRKRPDNLAVIEIKMVWKNSRRDFDCQKLEAYKDDLKYKYAIYLEIGEKQSHFRFI